MRGSCRAIRCSRSGVKRCTRTGKRSFRNITTFGRGRARWASLTSTWSWRRCAEEHLLEPLPQAKRRRLDEVVRRQRSRRGHHEAQGKRRQRRCDVRTEKDLLPEVERIAEEADED